jgi:16S rRNA (adenine1518-N6/adenine1519-N6)-dimethyltransferase
MLRQSLKGFAAARGLDLPAVIAAAGLEPTMRAEEVDVSGFVALARAAGEAASGSGTTGSRQGDRTGQAPIDERS